MADGFAIMTEIFNTVKFILVWFWWAILLLWLFFMKWRMKDWPVEAVIIEKRGSNLVKTNDRAGKYLDPYTGMTGYKLQKAKDTIPVLNYDWVMHNVYVPNTLLERLVAFLRGNIGTIFLFRYGTRQYKPIIIKENNKTKKILQPMKDENGQDIVVQVYQPFDPRDKMGLLDFEVVDWDNMNFMVQEQRASIERRKNKSDWVKQIAIPLAIIGATVIICVIMIKFGYDFASETRNAGGSVPNTASPNVNPNIPIIGDLMPGQ